ncbi:hypothetical protein [Sphingomonas sp. DT-204]|uniref:hypothetical protein n=1 Tax=Sphingomonas sp. DT-204 TaxID=3396166 RepID=UPI003F1C116B
MRNAMICAGAMLATVLVWPMVFSGGANFAVAAAPAPHHPGGNTMLVPPPTEPTPQPVSYDAGRVSRPGAPETCSQGYARAAPACTSEGCRNRALDALDICQGTGFWPD